MTQPKPWPAPRITPDGIMLGPRGLAAGLARCHVNTVRNHAPAIACDVDSHAVLVDLGAWVWTYRTTRAA